MPPLWNFSVTGLCTTSPTPGCSDWRKRPSCTNTPSSISPGLRMLGQTPYPATPHPLLTSLMTLKTGSMHPLHMSPTTLKSSTRSASWHGVASPKHLVWTPRYRDLRMSLHPVSLTTSLTCHQTSDHIGMSDITCSVWVMLLCMAVA